MNRKTPDKFEKQTKNSKCKYYPNCTTPNCPYFHVRTDSIQSEFSTTVLNVPQKQLCKFGAACNKGKLCPYLHLTPTESPIPDQVDEKMKCKFGVACNKGKLCPYRHSPPPPESLIPDQVDEKMKCKFGAACNKGKLCPYLHLTPPKSLIADQVDIVPSDPSTILCRYGYKCTNQVPVPPNVMQRIEMIEEKIKKIRECHCDKIKEKKKI